MHRKKTTLLRVQLLFAAEILVLYMLAQFAFPAAAAAAREIYRDAVTEPPILVPDVVEDAVRQAVRLLTQAR